MGRCETIILMNICIVHDNNGNVVVINREGKSWPGVAFPGGHVEKGESLTDSVVREIKEETGLSIRNVTLCGIQNWIEDDVRYMVFVYKTDSYEGTLTSSDEGKVWWTNISNLCEFELAECMPELVENFNRDTVFESFYYNENGKWVQVIK